MLVKVVKTVFQTSDTFRRLCLTELIWNLPNYAVRILPAILHVRITKKKKEKGKAKKEKQQREEKNERKKKG